MWRVDSETIKKQEIHSLADVDNVDLVNSKIYWITSSPFAHRSYNVKIPFFILQLYGYYVWMTLLVR